MLKGLSPSLPSFTTGKVTCRNVFGSRIFIAFSNSYKVTTLSWCSKEFEAFSQSIIIGSGAALSCNPIASGHWLTFLYSPQVHSISTTFRVGCHSGCIKVPPVFGTSGVHFSSLDQVTEFIEVQDSELIDELDEPREPPLDMSTVLSFSP